MAMHHLRPLLRRVPQGGECSQYFITLKQQLVADLSKNQNDKSLAGRVDPLIAPLVEHINANFQQYVTSSSCSGRISLFHKAKALPSPTTTTSSPTSSPPSTQREDATSPATADVAARKRGALGRGTLIQSHDPLPNVGEAVATQIQPALMELMEWRTSVMARGEVLAQEVLHMKFEPMILHVLCQGVEDASVLLQAASESGQMNSGIISCSRGVRDHPKIVCCITSPLSFDVPLLSRGEWICPVVPEQPFSCSAWKQMLLALTRQANVLFDENEKRMHRFREEMDRRATRQPLHAPILSSHGSSSTSSSSS